MVREACGREASQRLALYKRLAGVVEGEEIARLRSEMLDRFGPVPAAVEALLDVVGLRVAARVLGVERVEAQGGRALLTFAPSTPVTPERLLQAISRSRGTMRMLREFTVEAQIPRGPWPPIRTALTALLESLRP